MRQIVLLLALAGALVMVAAGAQAELRQSRWIEPAVDYLRLAPASGATLADVVTTANWQPLPAESPNFGYIRDTVWLRFEVMPAPGNRLLEIRYSQLDHINYYLLRDGELVNQVSTGDRLPFDQRPVKHRNFLFPFNASGDHHYQILLEVTTEGAMQIPLRVWQSADFFEKTSVEDQLHAVYYGILITVIFFNLFVYLALRETTYLLYVLSTTGYLLLIANLNGTTYQLLWPDLPWLHNQAMLLTIPLATTFTLLFSRAFLRLRRSSPSLDRLLQLTIAANLLVALTTFILDYNIAIRLTVALAIPSCLLLTIIGPVQWVRGNPQASYYTIAWGLLTLGSAITGAHKYGLLPNHFITFYGMELGSALEAILLTLALAARLFQERQQKILAKEAEIRAMAARSKAELRMMEQALHHPQTGLPNRTSFEMLVNDLIQREPDTRHAVAVIHLNNLEAITKTLGHRNTDRLLELAARRFNQIVRDLPGIHPVENCEDRAFHLASLEAATFGFVIDSDQIGNAPRLVLQGLDQLKEPIGYLGMQLPLVPQIGVAIFPDHARDTSSLIRRAYIARESEEARDRGMAYYKPARDSYSAERLTLVSEFRQALQQRQLELYFQPKLALRTRTVTGLEVLIRWPGRKGSIPVDELINMAEQTGLIKPLTRWVLAQAMTARSELLAAGHTVGLSVNISPNNLREPEFPQFVQQLMTDHPEHRGQITLEVTETSMMQDPVNSLRALKSLNAAGIPLAIDDFGSGYSSLSYIKQLPAREIKIDRSLVTDLAREAEDRVIVRTTIDMCHSLGYAVVAEGVEDRTTLELLDGMGCDMVQGFVLTRPLPLDEIRKWLDAGSGLAPCLSG